MKHIFLNKMYDYESLEISPANKDEVTPEAILDKWGYRSGSMPYGEWKCLLRAVEDYATIHAAKAWDAAVSYESQRDNFLNFCKPITAPNKEQFLQSLK